MTNELEKQFFQCFGIEPHYYCADEYVFEAMLEYECTEGNREKCKTCKKVCKAYPQITDRIYLELYCLICDYCVIAKLTVDELKQEILRNCIRLQRVVDIKHQVRTLFEEG